MQERKSTEYNMNSNSGVTEATIATHADSSELPPIKQEKMKPQVMKVFSGETVVSNPVQLPPVKPHISSATVSTKCSKGTRRKMFLKIKEADEFDTRKNTLEMLSDLDSASLELDSDYSSSDSEASDDEEIIDLINMQKTSGQEEEEKSQNTKKRRLQARLCFNIERPSFFNGLNNGKQSGGFDERPSLNLLQQVQSGTVQSGNQQNIEARSDSDDSNSQTSDSHSGFKYLQFRLPPQQKISMPTTVSQKIQASTIPDSNSS